MPKPSKDFPAVEPQLPNLSSVHTELLIDEVRRRRNIKTPEALEFIPTAILIGEVGARVRNAIIVIDGEVFGNDVYGDSSDAETLYVDQQAIAEVRQFGDSVSLTGLRRYLLSWLRAKDREIDESYTPGTKP